MAQSGRKHLCCIPSYCSTLVLHVDTKHGRHGDQGPFSLLCEAAEAGSRSQNDESGVFLHTYSLMVDKGALVFVVLLQIFTQASGHVMTGCFSFISSQTLFSKVRLHSLIIYHREYLMIRSVDMKSVLN